MRLVAVPELDDLEGLSIGELDALVVELDRVRRQVHTPFDPATVAGVVGQVERSGGYGSDGHSNVTAWGRATLNWSTSEASGFARAARMLTRLPSTATPTTNATLTPRSAAPSSTSTPAAE